MAFVDSTGTNTTMLVQPSGYGGNASGWNDGFGGNGAWWLLVLFLFAANGNGWGGGFGGNNGAIPYMMNNNTNNDVQRGFDQQAVMSSLGDINGAVTSGFAGVNQGMCSGFAGVTQNLTNGFNGVNQAISTTQMANMNQLYNLQSGLTNSLNTIAMNQQNGCYENRQAVSDLKYTVAQENCQDRFEAASNTRDILTAMNANTQSMLNTVNSGIQAILDKQCQQELDTLKAQNISLQNQLNMATMRESQAAQTATIIAGVNPTPVPAYVVQNPSCCNQNYYNGGCGCSM